ncbi:Holliday junction resolvase RuvX [Pseudohalioglobus sediminis]|uniref:Holliday junction resolvase RuvX n=1 Tax=Pseudohalioglobus sediminis TaxID=2606449 RepID=UPI0021D1FDE3|nr:Holliday junction resolvase RuvX [Pseudohalioglobus sediminis]
MIAFDFGLRQIGVAVGNTLLGTTQTLPIIKAKDGIPNWRDVEELIREWGPQLLVVGDPLNMDGSESELARRARKFARRLNGRLGLEVTMVDERLSSFEAKTISRERGHRGDYNCDPVDSLAAQLILETWLAQAS